MSDKKIIIRNCPCYDCGYCISAKVKERGCINCTDCVMKQIVELAKGYKEELIDRKTKKVVATRYFKLTKEILELLDIQEVE